MLEFQFIKNKTTGEEWLETSLNGKALLTTPQLNKGTAFTLEERKTFNLTGKLPSHVETLEKQIERTYQQYQTYETPLHKNVFLNELHDTNQVLFYKLVKTHLQEMLPIIYTPTVGQAVQQFSREFHQVRGLYINFEDQDNIEEILKNRSNPNIELIVVTDGGGVLGIGDQGVGAMMIPVAKLMVYGICGNINPLHTLPILLDVGTNNETLINDPFYLGWRHERVEGKEYHIFIDKFVTAIKKCFPQVLLHWEDFARDNAYHILDNYQDQLCTFNDDIQGTGVVALAALLSGVKANQSELSDQRIVVFGAGAAGVGISQQIVSAMSHHDITLKNARQQFWLIDRDGLLLENTPTLTSHQRPFARPASEIKDWVLENEGKVTLLDVINNIKPTVLMGCSAVPGAFTQDIIKTMQKHTPRPMIFPLSNPTSRAEATPENLVQWTFGQALVATGSPFPPVTYEGEAISIAQCNNALAFPGIGLGATAVQAKRVSVGMLWAAAEALTTCSPVLKDTQAPLLPDIQEAEATAKTIAIAVANTAREEGLARVSDTLTSEELIDQQIWSPGYVPYRRRYD